MDMNEQDLKRLRRILLQKRGEIFDRLQGLESDWDTLSEHEIEWEEKAQKADLSAIFFQLDELEQQEIEAIDRALAKMVAATFGACEQCRKTIALQRLEVLPATRFCKKCAHKAEI
jgi:RNA polymerase-binding transcription factor DksA